jgi:hypothetical protein
VDMTDVVQWARCAGCRLLLAVFLERPQAGQIGAVFTV